MGLQRIKNANPTVALWEYWHSANIMHDRAEFLYEDLDETIGAWQEYRTYYTYWLASLYVVMEGFEALGLRDAAIDDLLHKHRDSLRLFRNSAFHFHKEPHKFMQFHDDEGLRLNWAEGVHQAFADYFANHTLPDVRLLDRIPEGDT